MHASKDFYRIDGSVLFLFYFLETVGETCYGLFGILEYMTFNSVFANNVHQASSM